VPFADVKIFFVLVVTAKRPRAGDHDKLRKLKLAEGVV